MAPHRKSGTKMLPKERKSGTKRVCSKHIHPIKVDSGVTFESVGGLDEHIKSLREMVLIPLMYPDFFKRFNSKTPKGVLFYGPPGTGKTLLARALARECGNIRAKKVSFFMQKGADLMSKWYGESEKSIKRLFQQAHKYRPSIIFFDEIDTLAPVRSDGHGGDVFNSVVATLLTEMDGLWNRGEVIVIGATNRPDCLDPALRRPGRFDRELYFPPPNFLARHDILSINTRHWVPRPTADILDYIAQITSGFLGSDLSALCSEAVLRALRRVYPQIYNGNYKFLSLKSIDTQKVDVKLEDFVAAKQDMLPAGARYSQMTARKLSPQLAPLLGAQLDSAWKMLKQVFPHAEPSFLRSQGDADASGPSVFLVTGQCTDTHLAPALLANLEHCAYHELSMATLHSTLSSSPEKAILNTFSECRHSGRPCVIFIPNLTAVWEALQNTPGQALLLEQWRSKAAGDKVLLLATSAERYEELPEELRDIFPSYKNCVYHVRSPVSSEVVSYFTPLVEKISSLSNQPHKFTAGSLKRKLPDTANENGSNSKRAKLMNEAVLQLYEEQCEEIAASEEFSPDLGKTLKINADRLCSLGLEALTDLHAQLSNAVNINTTSANSKLGCELHAITSRYLKLSKL